jgi:hypothetical protein
MARKSRPGISPLQVLGVSDDGRNLLLGRRSAKTAAFKLPIDETLVEGLEAGHSLRESARRAAAHAELPPPVETTSSLLTVREIQSLLRQGKSASSIASKAGVAEEWVRRWEGPILWERDGAAARARSVPMGRARGKSSLPLGEAVVANLKRRKIPIDAEHPSEGWDAVKRARGNKWVVSFIFEARGHTTTARWEFDPDASIVVPLDRTAAALGWVAGRKKTARSRARSR